MFCSVLFQGVLFAGHSNSTDAFVKITSIKMKLEFVGCIVTNSAGGLHLTKLAAGFLESWLVVEIQNCTFQNNTKQGSGAAVEIHSFGTVHNNGNAAHFVHITNSTFQRNKLLRSGSTSSEGGAISIKGPAISPDCHVLSVTIEHCEFLNNQASDGGGALHLTDSCLKTNVSDSSFKITDQYSESVKGIFILSYAEITVETSMFTWEVKDGSLQSPSFLELQMLSEQAKVKKLNMTLQCPAWYWPAVDDSFVATQAKEITIMCLSCPASQYILSDGSFQVSYGDNEAKIFVHATTFTANDSACKPCPAGAYCPGNDFVAKPNFWGYITKLNEIDMHQCPADYCCIENCTGYKKCSGHRTGVLCGSCEEDYSLSMLSSDCVTTEECDDIWLWPFVTLAVFLYIAWYTFKNDVFAIPALILKKVSKYCLQASNLDEGNNTDKGYFGIVTYFVQIKAVMQLSISLDYGRTIEKFFYQIELYTKLLLNFEWSYFSRDACALKGVTMTDKILFRLLFLIGIYFTCNLVFVCIIFLQQVSHWAGHNMNKLQQFKLKLILGLVEIIKYTYLAFSSVVFYSLTCTSINKNIVWFYDGSVQCYSNWQVAMSLFAAFYLIPYPLFVHLTMKLLKNKQISRYSFFPATCFPFPVIIYWVLLSRKHKIVHTSNTHNVVDEDRTANIEQMIYGGFKGGFSESDKGTQYWEAVLMFRRLLISATILIPNALIQLSICLVLCIVFLVHHLKIHPFKHNVSNMTETVSLSMLCGVAAINLLKAAFLYANINPEGPQVEVLNNLGLVETLLVVVLIMFILCLETVFELFVMVKNRPEQPDWKSMLPFVAFGNVISQQDHPQAGPSSPDPAEDVELETVVDDNLTEVVEENEAVSESDGEERTEAENVASAKK